MPICLQAFADRGEAISFGYLAEVTGFAKGTLHGALGTRREMIKDVIDIALTDPFGSKANMVALMRAHLDRSDKRVNKALFKTVTERYLQCM
jgi:hypothetical protein